MRMLFTVQPLHGHFHAMAPLALAAQAAGHSVACATAARFGPVLQQWGLTHIPCGVDFDSATDVFATLPVVQAARANNWPPVLEQISGFVQGLGARMADDLLAQGAAWQPDLIVRDPLEFGGYLAAERLGIPHASVMWAIYIDPRLTLPHLLDAQRIRYGLPADPELATFDRFLVFKFLPPAWQFETPREPAVTRAFCTPPLDQRAAEPLPPWLDDLPDRPTVYATLGTTFNQAPDVFRALIAALGSLPVNGIITVGRTVDPAQFGALPANLHIAHYIPHARLLPRCHALVFHGGYNSLHDALWHGLPMVAVPQAAGDQLPTAQKLAELGLGTLVTNRPLDPQAIAAAIHHVLAEPSYRAQAQAMGKAMRALPPLSEAVRQLERLAG